MRASPAGDLAAYGLATMLLLFAPVATALAPRASAPSVDYADVTAFGARGDGITDDTAAFRAAAATAKPLWIPKPSAHYRLTGTVKIRNGMKGDGSMPVVKMDGATGDWAHVMFFMDQAIGTASAPIEVNGVWLDGGWDGTTKPAGEWSHLLIVKRSRHVEVHGNTMVFPKGDCIYVGNHTPPLGVSDNVNIHGNKLYRPYRAAIGIISGRNGTIRNNEITKLNAYVNAIDFEPNDNPVDHFRHWTVDGNWFNSPLRGAISGNVKHASNPPSGDLTLSNNRGIWSSRAGGFWHTVLRSRAVANVTLLNNYTDSAPPPPRGAR
jgi:hypothetical protein